MLSLQAFDRAHLLRDVHARDWKLEQPAPISAPILDLSLCTGRAASQVELSWEEEVSRTYVSFTRYLEAIFNARSEVFVGTDCYGHR